MIDTKELRQLAQDATPGPWYVRSSNYDVRNIYSANAITDSEGFTFQPVIATVEDIDVPRWRANARLIAAANPAAISGLLDRLEAAEKVRDWNAERLEEAIEELKALRAKIEAAEKQKPVMWANSSNIISTRIWPARGSVGYQHTCSETKTAYHDTPLYLAPGAKGEDK